MKKLILSILALGVILTVTHAETKYEVGAGVNSAVLGVTANWEVSKKTEVFAGIGLGAVVGGRYNIDDKVRMNISYGTQGYGFIEKQYTSFSNESTIDIEHLHGANIGLDYDFGDKDGWQAGLAYMLTSNIDDVKEKYKKMGAEEVIGSSKGVRLTLAYRY